MSEELVPRLNPDVLKKERHDVDLGIEIEGENHDNVDDGRDAAPGKTSDVVGQPTGGALPPAR